MYSELSGIGGPSPSFIRGVEGENALKLPALASVMNRFLDDADPRQRLLERASEAEIGAYRAAFFSGVLGSTSVMLHLLLASGGSGLLATMGEAGVVALAAVPTLGWAAVGLGAIGVGMLISRHFYLKDAGVDPNTLTASAIALGVGAGAFYITSGFWMIMGVAAISGDASLALSATVAGGTGLIKTMLAMGNTVREYYASPEFASGMARGVGASENRVVIPVARYPDFGRYGEISPDKVIEERRDNQDIEEAEEFYIVEGEWVVLEKVRPEGMPVGENQEEENWRIRIEGAEAEGDIDTFEENLQEADVLEGEVDIPQIQDHGRQRDIAQVEGVKGELDENDKLLGESYDPLEEEGNRGDFRPEGVPERKLAKPEDEFEPGAPREDDILPEESDEGRPPYMSELKRVLKKRQIKSNSNKEINDNVQKPNSKRNKKRGETGEQEGLL